MIIFNQNKYDLYNKSQLQELIKDVRKYVIANVQDYSTLINRIAYILNTKNEVVISDKALDWEQYGLYIDVVSNQNDLVRVLKEHGYYVATSWDSDNIKAKNDDGQWVNIIVDPYEYVLKEELNAQSRIVFSTELIKYGFSKIKNNEMYYI